MLRFYRNTFHRIFTVFLLKCNPNSLLKLRNYASDTRFSRKWPITLLAATAFMSQDVTTAANEILKQVKDGNYDELSRLIQNKRFAANSDTRHVLGWTPLMLAVVNRKYNIVELLIENGANVNERDYFSGCFRIAGRQAVNSADIAKTRLEEFSDYLNPHSDFSGTTPLHYAVLIDDLALTKRLLVSGADPSLRNNRGHLPVMYAKSQEIIDLLKQAEKDQLKKKRALDMAERRKVPLEDLFRKNIIGQTEAIKTVAGAIRRMEMGWQNAEHPIVFLFLGSSGIGKTELAKQVAAYLHPDEKKAFIRIDMSEYQQKHEVSKLIGSPPGYVGHDQGGQLTQALTECPDAVVLFDEMEKAHPDVMTILLQLFDEGRLTDGKGKTIECKDAIFIMTSNVGSQAIADYVNNNKTGEITRDFKEHVMRPLLRRHFVRDEFLGRVNEMVYFVPFSRPELKQITTKSLNFWRDKALKDHGIHLTWSEQAVDLLLEGYDVYFGARSLQYEIERKVINQLVVAELRDMIGEDSRVEIVTKFKDGAKQILALKINDEARKKNDEIVEIHSIASEWASAPPNKDSF